MKRLAAILLMLSLIITSCYYDVEEELYPFQTDCETTNMSFVADIIPILETNCYSCHNQANVFGGVILENHAQVKSYVDNSTLLGVIRHDAGFSPMPKGGNKLLDCDISKIEAWITDGALDN